MDRQAYMQLLRSTDPHVAELLDQGYAFVTNAFRPEQVPPGVSVRTSEQAAERLRAEGWEVVMATAYDEAGRALSQMASLWRRRRT